jgi:hypothetical protein
VRITKEKGLLMGEKMNVPPLRRRPQEEVSGRGERGITNLEIEEL